MNDHDWDIGAVVRSKNISKPDNVVAPNLYLDFFKCVWNSFVDFFSPDRTNFNGLSEILSLEFDNCSLGKTR